MSLIILVLVYVYEVTLLSLTTSVDATSIFINIDNEKMFTFGHAVRAKMGI